MKLHNTGYTPKNITFNLREIGALDWCRSVNWATSDDGIAENTELTKEEAHEFVNKCIVGNLVNEHK